MRNWLKFTVFALVFACSPVFAAPVVGDVAPELKGVFLDAAAYDLAALRGQVVIVHFWASWCAPCKAEMPVLDEFLQAHAAEGLTSIVLSADRERDRDEVMKQMQPFHFQTGMLGDVAVNGFGKPGVIPVTYIVDRGGVVRARLTPDPDPLTKAQLQTAIVPLLMAK